MKEIKVLRKLLIGTRILGGGKKKMPPSKAKFLAEELIKKLFGINVIFYDTRKEGVAWLSNEIQKITETEAWEDA